MLVLVTTVFTVLLFQCYSKAFAYPPAKTHELNAARRATSLLSPSPGLFNASTLTIQTGPITCFREGDVKTSLAGCRPTLNRIRTFPAYRTRQLFRMSRYPLAPAKPPMIIHVGAADCAIGLACEQPFRDDMFSWEDVRAAATEVAVNCEDNYGYGGWTPVGAGVGWHVKVLGFVEDAGGVNRTVVGEEVDGTANMVLVADS